MCQHLLTIDMLGSMPYNVHGILTTTLKWCDFTSEEQT